jgi:hypothetical protein
MTRPVKAEWARSSANCLSVDEEASVYIRALAAVTPSPSPPFPSAPRSPSPGPSVGLIGLEPGDAVVFVALCSLVVAALLAAAIVYDVRLAAQLQIRRLNLVDKLADRFPDARGAAAMVTSMRQPTRGVQGLTRSLIALTILTAVVLALAATLVSTAPEAAGLRQTVIASLLSVFATIVGFYFGARTAQTSADAASDQRTPLVRTGSERTITVTAGAPGAPGTFAPAGTAAEYDLDQLQRASPPVEAVPPSRWEKGSYVNLKDKSEAFWDGNSWKSGRSPG